MAKVNVEDIINVTCDDIESETAIVVVKSKSLNLEFANFAAFRKIAGRLRRGARMMMKSEPGDGQPYSVDLGKPVDAEENLKKARAAKDKKAPKSSKAEEDED